MAVAVTLTRTTFTNTAAVAALALPLWATPVLGQETQGTDQAQQTDQFQQQAQQSGDAAQAATGQQAQGQATASDTLIATVGEAEIRNSDLMRVIGALPSQLSGQPPEMLVPMALQQLVVREAIVQEARAQGLAGRASRWPCSTRPLCSSPSPAGAMERAASRSRSDSARPWAMEPPSRSLT